MKKSNSNYASWYTNILYNLTRLIHWNIRGQTSLFINSMKRGNSQSPGRLSLISPGKLIKHSFKSMLVSLRLV